METSLLNSNGTVRFNKFSKWLENFKEILFLDDGKNGLQIICNKCNKLFFPSLDELKKLKTKKYKKLYCSDLCNSSKTCGYNDIDNLDELVKDFKSYLK